MNTGRPILRLHRRKSASEYLKETWQIERAESTLAKDAVVGGGPKFYKDGPFPLYPEEELDRWARERLGEFVGSTSELSDRAPA